MPPTSPDILLMQFFAVISMSFAARGCEATNLRFEDVQRFSRMDGSGNTIYHFVIEHTRAKSSGPGTSDGHHSLVVGAMEVAIIIRYLNCFKVEDQCGRLFRRLIYKTQQSKIVGTQIPIGKNIISTYGKRVAQILQKRDAQFYTGHCWRRTAITLAASAGLSIPQLKVLSGHRSDTVVQGYIDNSDHM